MRKIIALLTAALFSSVVLAATAPSTLSYVRATTRSDGTPLASSEIASHAINCTYTPTGGSAAACVGLLPTSFSGSSTGGSVMITVTQDGQACFTLQTVDTGGRSSVPTSPVCKAIVIPNPSPPGGVTIAINLQFDGQTVVIDPAPVYSFTILGAKGSAVVAFVQSGKPAGDRMFDYKGYAYCRLNRADVIPYGQTVPSRIAGPCGPAT